MISPVRKDKTRLVMPQVTASVGTHRTMAAACSFGPLLVPIYRLGYGIRSPGRGSLDSS